MPHPAETMIEALTGRADTPCIFQLFVDHEGSDVLPRNRLARFADIADALTRLNERGAGVFLTVNRCAGDRRIASEVDALRALFVDGDDTPQPDFWPCPPTYLHQRSAIRWACFWRLKPGEDLARFKAAQLALAGYYGGDKRAHDLPRVMRLPGFVHRKDPAHPEVYQPVLVDLTAEYTIDEVLRAHGIDPMAVAAAVDDALRDGAAPAVELPAADPRPEEVAAAAALFDRPVEVNGRHHTALALTIECVAAGMPDADLMARLDDWFRAHGRTPQPREKRNLIRDARKGLKAGRFTATTPGVGARTDFTAVPASSVVPAASALTPDAAAAQAKDLTQDNWTDKLVRARGGDWKSHARNVQLVLEHDDRLNQCLRYNLFSNAVEVVKAPWRTWACGTSQWIDADATAMACWLAGAFNAQHPAMSDLVIHAAIKPFAMRHAYHPVRDWLEPLRWDGKPRLGTWLVRYLGAEDSPYVRAVGRRFLIGAVARVMRPGCKLDTMLVLEGAQGIGKSTAVRVLFDPWYTDAELDPGNKDASATIRGHWGVEFGEMHSARRAEVSQLKAFLSRREDRQRDAYERAPQTHPRQSVFVGTTNRSDYLQDPTGGRRFWPVVCGRIDLGRLDADKAQLWAEAAAEQEAGTPWWLSAEEEPAAQEIQAARQLRDPWIDPIVSWANAQIDFVVSGTLRITAREVLIGALGLTEQQLDITRARRVGECLRTLGFKPQTIRRGETVQWGFVALHPITQNH